MQPHLPVPRLQLPHYYYHTHRQQLPFHGSWTLGFLSQLTLGEAGSYLCEFSILAGIRTSAQNFATW
jgi:hypothetical protein